MGSNPESPERIGQVGPIELTAFSDTTPDPTVISQSGHGPVGEHLTGWWQRLSPRRRRAGVLMAAATALGLLTTTLASSHPQPEPAAPPPTVLPPQPLPANPVLVSYRGITGAVGPGERRFTMLLTLTDNGSTPMTVLQIAQPSVGLALAPDPPTPIALRVGQQLPVRVAATIEDCSTASTFGMLSYLSLIIGTAGTTRFENTVPGPAYPAELNQQIQDDCPNLAG